MRNAKVAAPIFAVSLLLTACTGAADEGVSQATPSADKTIEKLAQTKPGGTGAAETVQIGAVDLHERGFELNWREAISLAQASFAGGVSEIELEADDIGKYHYKVEMLSDTQEYVRYMEAETKILVREETKELESEDVRVERLKDAIDLAAVVPPDSAMEAVRVLHPGQITAWKLEGHATGPIYTVDVDKAGPEQGDQEVFVDALTGKIIQGIS